MGVPVISVLTKLRIPGLPCVESLIFQFSRNPKPMASQENIGSLEEEALKRKERLKALKRKHDETGKDGDKLEDGSKEGVAGLPRLAWFVI
jgi:hypothetical protein